MKIDWASLGLVAVTTVVAAIAIVGIYSLGVLALTSRGRDGTAGGDGVPLPSGRRHHSRSVRGDARSSAWWSSA